MLRPELLGPDLEAPDVDEDPWATPTTQTSQAPGLLVSGGAEFDTARVLSRPEVRRTISQIRGANTHIDRMAPVLALIEEIG
jgi:hypothetical protein